VKKGRKRKLAAPDGPKKPTVISTNSPKKPSSPAKKKAKKRNPWSDSEESAADDSDRSDVDMDASFGDIIEREKVPRRAAGWLLCFLMLSSPFNSFLFKEVQNTMKFESILHVFIVTAVFVL